MQFSVHKLYLSGPRTLPLIFMTELCLSSDFVFSEASIANRVDPISDSSIWSDLIWVNTTCMQVKFNLLLK